MDSDDEFEYEEVPVDEDFVPPGEFKQIFSSIRIRMCGRSIVLDLKCLIYSQTCV